MRRSIPLVAIAVLLLATGLSAKPVRPSPPAPPKAPLNSRTPRVVLETNQGKIVFELDAEKAPVTVQNFLKYVDDGFYNGTVFHRTIPDFVIQGGGFEAGMKEKKTRAPIPSEASNGLTNQRGTLAAARTSDPNSATAQFFINLRDNKFIDPAQSPDHVGYCVFGKVIEGMDVVDRIAGVKTETRAGHSNVPVADVVILSARRLN